MPRRCEMNARDDRAGERGREHGGARGRATGSRRRASAPGRSRTRRRRRTRRDRTTAARSGRAAGCSPSRRASRPRSRRRGTDRGPTRGSHHGAVPRISDERDQRPGHERGGRRAPRRRRGPRRSGSAVVDRGSLAVPIRPDVRINIPRCPVPVPRRRKPRWSASPATTTSRARSPTPTRRCRTGCRASRATRSTIPTRWRSRPWPRSRATPRAAVGRHPLRQRDGLRRLPADAARLPRAAGRALGDLPRAHQGAARERRGSAATWSGPIIDSAIGELERLREHLDAAHAQGRGARCVVGARGRST